MSRSGAAQAKKPAAMRRGRDFGGASFGAVARARSAPDSAWVKVSIDAIVTYPRQACSPSDQFLSSFAACARWAEATSAAAFPVARSLHRTPNSLMQLGSHALARLLRATHRKFSPRRQRMTRPSLVMLFGTALAAALGGCDATLSPRPKSEVEPSAARRGG